VYIKQASQGLQSVETSLDYDRFMKVITYLKELKELVSFPLHFRAIFGLLPVSQ
jgi:hypothetical protein